MRRCDQCRHYFGYPPSDRPDRISISGDEIRGGGECRRNPPVVSEELQPIGSFPVVFNDYWCGQFESNHQDHFTSQPNRLISIDANHTIHAPNQTQPLAQ